MFKNINKASSSILLGAFTCSGLFSSSGAVDASNTAIFSTAANFIGDGIKFIVKDVIVPLLSSVLPALITSIATIFATPILYFVLGYIPYYNHCVLHNKKDLGVVTRGLIWGARKFAGLLDDNASDKLISCEDLAKNLGEVENSINSIQGNFEVIKEELEGLKKKLNKVKGKDTADGAWGRYLKYKLAVLFFSETKTSYDDCEKKIKRLAKLLEDKESVFEFLGKSDVLIEDCLGEKGKNKDPKAFFKKPGAFHSKNGEDKGYLYVLDQIEKNKKYIKSLVENGEEIKKDYINEKVKHNLSTLKDFLDILQAKKEVSKIKKTVTNMEKKEEEIINSCKDFSSYTIGMGNFYSECVEQLEKLEVVDKTKSQLSYSGEVVNKYLTSKIEEIKNKQIELGDLKKYFECWKKDLNSRVENFNSFMVDMNLENTFSQISRADHISNNIKDQKVESLFHKEVATYSSDLSKEFKRKFEKWKEAIEKNKSDEIDKIKCFDNCKELEVLQKCFEKNKDSFIDQYRNILEKMLKIMQEIQRLTSSALLNKDFLSKPGKKSNTVSSNVATVLDNVNMVCTLEKEALSLFRVIEVKAFREVLNGLIDKFKKTCKDISFSEEMLEYLLDCSKDCFESYKEILTYFSNYDYKDVLGFGVSVDELRNIVYKGRDVSLRESAIKELLDKKKNSVSKDLEKFVLKLLKNQQKNIKKENCDALEYAKKIKDVLSLQKGLLFGRKESDAEKVFIDYEFKFISTFVEKFGGRSSVNEVVDYIFSGLNKTKELKKSSGNSSLSTSVFVDELASLLCKVLEKVEKSILLEKVSAIESKFTSLGLNNKQQTGGGIKDCVELIKKLKSEKEEKTHGKKGDNSFFANSSVESFLKTLGLLKSNL